MLQGKYWISKDIFQTLSNCHLFEKNLSKEVENLKWVIHRNIYYSSSSYNFESINFVPIWSLKLKSTFGCQTVLSYLSVATSFLHDPSYFGGEQQVVQDPSSLELISLKDYSMWGKTICIYSKADILGILNIQEEEKLDRPFLPSIHHR